MKATFINKVKSIERIIYRTEVAIEELSKFLFEKAEMRRQFY
jgi:hypothetical protein